MDDIEGTRPIQKKQFAPRDPLNIFDIPGTKAKTPYQRTRTGKDTVDSINYEDVTRKSWASRRMTNPLEPVYTVRDEAIGDFGRKRESNQLNEEYGIILGSKPT